MKLKVSTCPKHGSTVMQRNRYRNFECNSGATHSYSEFRSWDERIMTYGTTCRAVGRNRDLELEECGNIVGPAGKVVQHLGVVAMQCMVCSRPHPILILAEPVHSVQHASILPLKSSEWVPPMIHSNCSVSSMAEEESHPARLSEAAEAHCLLEDPLGLMNLIVSICG